MEISRDAMLRVVKAARMADKLAQDTKALLMDRNGWTVADEISGFLDDALFNMIGEKLEPGQDFANDSVTMMLIRSKLSDAEVTDEFISIAEENKPKLPKPNLVSRDEFNAMVRKFGGYKAETPEGEWQ